MLRRISFILILSLFAAFGLIHADENPVIPLFCKADYTQKLAIVDSLLAIEPVPIGFFDKFLNEDSCLNSFESICVGRVFQTRLVFRLSAYYKSDYEAVLRRYFYGMPKSRPLRRPSADVLSHGAKIISELKDPFDIEWAITQIPWLGDKGDIWIFKKSDSTWLGPWFTGIHTQKYFDKSLKKIIAESCSLAWHDGQLHLIIPETNLDSIISFQTIIADDDKDGFYNVEESRIGTDPKNPDTDSDGIIDSEDMNPLAGGKKELSSEDYALLAGFRYNAQEDYNYFIYHLSVDSIENIEYYSPSDNTLIRQYDPRQVGENGYSFRPTEINNSMFYITIHTKRLDENSIKIDVRLSSERHFYLMENINGLWLITENLGEIDY
jgi:hypothetical protein